MAERCTGNASEWRLGSAGGLGQAPMVVVEGELACSKNAARRRRLCLSWRKCYNVDSISNPQASRRASGMYLEFLFRRAHSRRRVDRMYWSGGSLNSLVICSKEVTVGTTGPMGSGLPQFGFPRRFAIDLFVLILRKECFSWFNLGRGWGCERTRGTYISILGIFCSKINRRALYAGGSVRAGNARI